MQLLPTSYLFTFGSVYMSMPLSHFVPAYPFPSPCPQVHSLHLRLYSCPALRFIRTRPRNLNLKNSTDDCEGQLGLNTTVIHPLLLVSRSVLYDETEQRQSHLLCMVLHICKTTVTLQLPPSPPPLLLLHPQAEDIHFYMM